LIVGRAVGELRPGATVKDRNVAVAGRRVRTRFRGRRALRRRRRR